MASGFSSKYGGGSSSSSSTNRPDCFGDEEYFDIDDQHCRQCPSKMACQLKITRRAQSKRGSYSPAKSKKEKKKDEVVRGRQDMSRYTEVEPEEGDTFASALIHNASLNAIQASLDTISHGWSEIPRKSYHNIFHSARKKSRRE